MGAQALDCLVYDRIDLPAQNEHEGQGLDFTVSEAACVGAQEGEDCQGLRFVLSRSDATRGSALDWPVLEGYIIGSG